MSDIHPWIVARNRRKLRKQDTVDFRDAEVKTLVVQATTPGEARLIRRILAEICLQTYRIRIRHSRPVRRMGRRAARSLAEGLFHGFLSLNPEPNAGKAAPPMYTLSEIPGVPSAAFSFLYSVVFRDLFCGGDITNIGRQHGNGDLELEMLIMVGAGAQSGSDGRALDNPQRSVQVPVWFSVARGRFDETARSPSLDYLFAICRCAKRACRVGLFRAALDTVRTMHEERPLSPSDQLTLCKLESDLALLSYQGTWRERKVGMRLWRDVIDAVVQCCFPTASDDDNRPRATELRSQLLGMKRTVRELVRAQLPLQISTSDLDAAVDQTCVNVLKVCRPRGSHARP